MGSLHRIDATPGQRRRFRVSSPLDGSDLGTFDVHTADDVRAAVRRARAAQPAWEALGPKRRAAVLQAALAILVRDKDRYIEVMRQETGRTVLDTILIEVFAACDALNFWSSQAPKLLRDRDVRLHLLKHKRAQITYKALGVVGVISPWNGPFILSINPVIQALVAGNAVVLKPSEITPRCGLLVGELFAEAGLPDGVLQVLTGDGETGAALPEAGIDKLVFTGSVKVGRLVGEACGRNLVPCVLELGGKDAAIVCADADLHRAVGGIMFGALMNAGQVCFGVERVYVVDAIHDAFVTELVARVGELEVGRDIAPFIMDGQQDIVDRHVREAVAAGARVLVGGEKVGKAYAPTVIVDVTPEMALMREETFGPVIPVVRVADEEEALRLANDCDFALGGTVWSRDRVRSQALARRMETGSVTINDSTITYGVLDVPFGGRKQSGVGRANGAGALLDFVHPMPIISNRIETREESVWFPYTPEKAEQMLKAVDAVFGSPLRWLLR